MNLISTIHAAATRRLPLLIGILPVVLVACNGGDDGSDAFGNFEATEIVVSTEATGRIEQLDVEEGEHLPAGRLVGYVDTTQLALRKDQLAANKVAMQSRIDGVRAQINVFEEQKRVAEVERDRILRLLESHAATQKQRDDVEGQIAVIDRQIASTKAQNATIRREMDALDVQIRQLEDLIHKSRIINPVNGTVLVKYMEAFEMMGPGNPIYRIADLSTVYLRAYVSGDQLSDLTPGQQVTVIFDDDKTSNHEVDGVVSWISSQAEFTPKTIQTKEERVNLVYAFKVRVDNPDGSIKIGMPGEVRFTTTPG